MIFNQMREAVSSIMHEIHHHPFNLELAHGTLAQDKFTCYLIQDALYLAEYSRALALVAAKLSGQRHAQQFMQFALGAVQAESELHLNYLHQYNQTTLTSAQMSPTCFMYTNYLLKTASVSSVEEGVASLLPCFWVYREVGKKILEIQQEKNNPYHHWIEMYSGEQFNASVEVAIEIMNELGGQASGAIREKMIFAFIKATQLEWMFWDSAYRKEQWQVAPTAFHLEVV